MDNNRDDFTKGTIEILAKRAGYMCSNPQCRKATIGSNEDKQKSTSIGIAAHITAASGGGPRYDNNINNDQRRHIENGIWLCSNCATLIDKDSAKYTVDLLRKWKLDVEKESAERLNGELLKHPKGIPFLEADLIWTSGMRSNRGYSNKNPIEMHEGVPVIMISGAPIIHWVVLWNFNFTIFNNSNYPAFNLKIESVGTEHFSEIDRLPKLNNLPPLKNIDLKAKYETFVEGDYTVPDKMMKSRIPESFKNLTLKLTYLDEGRKEHINLIEFSGNEVINTKV